MRRNMILHGRLNNADDVVAGFRTVFIRVRVVAEDDRYRRTMGANPADSNCDAYKSFFVPLRAVVVEHLTASGSSRINEEGRSS